MYALTLEHARTYKATGEFTETSQPFRGAVLSSNSARESISLNNVHIISEEQRREKNTNLYKNDTDRVRETTRELVPLRNKLQLDTLTYSDGLEIGVIVSLNKNVSKKTQVKFSTLGRNTTKELAADHVQ